MSISDAAWQARGSRLFASGQFLYAESMINPGRALTVSIVFLLLANTRLFGNGGAWQTGVPVTGNAAASDQKKSTNVTIEDEKLTIDLHQEFAAVEVRYRMRNTGGEVAQDFFFPVERWAESEDEGGNTMTDLEGYSMHGGRRGIEVRNGRCEGREAEGGERYELGRL